jgi:hypothetical protein
MTSIEEADEKHRETVKAKLRKKWGAEHDRRLRDVHTVLHALLGRSALEAFVVAPDENGHPIGDNLKTLLALDRIANTDGLACRSASDPEVLGEFAFLLRKHPVILTALAVVLGGECRFDQMLVPVTWLDRPMTKIRRKQQRARPV